MTTVIVAMMSRDRWRRRLVARIIMTLYRVRSNQVDRFFHGNDARTGLRQFGSCLGYSFERHDGALVVAAFGRELWHWLGCR